MTTEPHRFELSGHNHESENCSVVSNSLRPHGLYSTCNSPGQNTGVGSLSLFQGIFSTQGSNPGLLQCRQNLYQLSHKERPRILDWVVYPFSSGPSEPRNRTGCPALHVDSLPIDLRRKLQWRKDSLFNIDVRETGQLPVL